MCEGLPRAAGPRPSGDPHRETGWRSEPRGSRPPAPDPASAQPGLDAGTVRAERRRDADRRWPVRRARPGTRGPGHRAGRVRARRSGSSPRPPGGQRAVGLQGSDLGVQQLALEQHLAQLRLQPLGLQRLAIGGPCGEAGLSSGDEGVLPSAQGRSRDAQCAREYLQALTPQQAQDRITLALARHAPTPAQTNRARSCCLCRHRHPPADHVRVQGVSANREAQHLDPRTQAMRTGAAQLQCNSEHQASERPHGVQRVTWGERMERSKEQERGIPAMVRTDPLPAGMGSGTPKGIVAVSDRGTPVLRMAGYRTFSLVWLALTMAWVIGMGLWLYPDVKEEFEEKQYLARIAKERPPMITGDCTRMRGIESRDFIREYKNPDRCWVDLL